RSHRELTVRALWVLADGASWAIAVLLALWTRLSLDPDLLTQASPWIVAGLAAVLHGAIGLTTGPYLVRHMRGSFDEVTSVVKTALITGLAIIAIAWATPEVFLPRSVALLAPAMAIVLML